MFKRENMKGLVLGAIIYFIVTLILDLLNIENESVKLLIFVVIFLIYYLITKLLNKNNKV